MSMDIEDTCNDEFLECPHCHYTHPDSWELISDGEDYGEHDCHSCDKTFIWNAVTTVTFTGIALPKKKGAK